MLKFSILFEKGLFRFFDALFACIFQASRMYVPRLEKLVSYLRCIRYIGHYLLIISPYTDKMRCLLIAFNFGLVPIPNYASYAIFFFFFTVLSMKQLKNI